MGNIITIGRQLGSGGKLIGKLVAEKLGYKFYDKDVLAEIAKSTGLSSNLFEGIDDKPTNSFLYALVMGVQSGKGLYYQYNDVLNGDNLFKIQSDLIKDLASKDDCVFVGRCADYILRKSENLTKIFCYADTSFRIKTIIDRNGVSEKEASSAVSKADKRRSNYYNFYTNQTWGNMENYDLAINTATLSREDATELILKYIEMKK